MIRLVDDQTTAVSSATASASSSLLAAAATGKVAPVSSTTFLCLGLSLSSPFLLVRKIGLKISSVENDAFA